MNHLIDKFNGLNLDNNCNDNDSDVEKLTQFVKNMELDDLLELTSKMENITLEEKPNNEIDVNIMTNKGNHIIITLDLNNLIYTKVNPLYVPRWSCCY